MANLTNLFKIMHYKHYKKCLSKYDIETNVNNEIVTFASKIPDAAARETMMQFAKDWPTHFTNGEDVVDIIWKLKK